MRWNKPQTLEISKVHLYVHKKDGLTAELPQHWNLQVTSVSVLFCPIKSSQHKCVQFILYETRNQKILTVKTLTPEWVFVRCMTWQLLFPCKRLQRLWIVHLHDATNNIIFILCVLHFHLCQGRCDVSLFICNNFTWKSFLLDLFYLLNVFPLNYTPHFIISNFSFVNFKFPSLSPDNCNDITELFSQTWQSFSRAR